MRHRGDTKAQSARYTHAGGQDQRCMCPGLIWPRSSILASQRHHQSGGRRAAERLKAKMTATTEKTHLSSEEKMIGLRRMHLALKSNTSCALVVTQLNVSGLCRGHQALTARMDRVKDHWTLQHHPVYHRKVSATRQATGQLRDICTRGKTAALEASRCASVLNPCIGLALQKVLGQSYRQI